MIDREVAYLHMDQLLGRRYEDRTGVYEVGYDPDGSPRFTYTVNKDYPNE